MAKPNLLKWSKWRIRVWAAKMKKELIRSMHSSGAHSKARTACARCLEAYIIATTILTVLLPAKMTCSFRTCRKVIKKEIQDISRNDRCLGMHQANNIWLKTKTKVDITHRNKRLNILTSGQEFIYRRKADDSNTSCPAIITLKISAKSSLTQASFYLNRMPCRSSCTRAKRQRSTTDLKALKECPRPTNLVHYIWQSRLSSVQRGQTVSLSLCSNWQSQIVRGTNTSKTPCRRTSKAMRCHWVLLNYEKWTNLWRCQGLSTRQSAALWPRIQTT